MDACSPFARTIDLYLDGELLPPQVVALEGHLQICRACAERAAFHRAARASLRRVVRAEGRAPEALRSRVRAAVVGDRLGVRAGGRLLPWRVVVPLCAAAACLLVWASWTRRPQPAGRDGVHAARTAAAPIVIERLIDELVEQHARPLPPEVTSPRDLAELDPYVGVPVRAAPLGSYGCRLVGARILTMAEQRAAMIQYMLENSRRLSVYVWDPRHIRMVTTALRERQVRSEPVLVGHVRGYSVAAVERRGVGYAVASDLDDDRSAEIAMAVGRSP